MSWDQIVSARTGGKKQLGIPISKDEDVAEVAKNWRKYVGI